ncbi:hypothetical protein DPQ25_08195 [Hydrogeniiclostridium mannosilyticum]|uniref:Uncharacterized protein n=1 Tax=Hydrogeniiclostridium mannosilyticum TaxID=2764322 RepID=A0A328UD05_9FIRM|nr:hypothetical protein DPQ25_08195 [Hydrogeniiclostridium mannosilyticum]
MFQKVDFVKQRFFDSDFYILPKAFSASITGKIPDFGPRALCLCGAVLIYSLRHAFTFSIHVIV